MPQSHFTALLKHVARIATKPLYRERYFQLKRLQKKERYQVCEVSLENQTIELVDAASFIFMYEEIFDHEIYRFNSFNSTPRIIDGGANIGLSVLYFKKLYPNSEIIAFEPDEKVFSTLTKNINYSAHKEGITLVQKALWNEETTLEFMSEGADAGRVQHVNRSCNIMKVSTVRLRDYLAQTIDFLKLDIEGAELEVIRDCEDLLCNVDRMFIEYHSFLGMPQKLSELLEIISRSGFRFYLQPCVSLPQPLNEIRSYQGMDAQVNIFAYRENSGVNIL